MQKLHNDTSKISKIKKNGDNSWAAVDISASVISVLNFCSF